MSENGQQEQQQQMIMLAAIGDLEVNRRQLVMEIQARDARIEELEHEILRMKDEEVALDS